MSETLKVWAHNSSHNPIDEHQKQHADDTLMLIAERDKLKAEVENLTAERGHYKAGWDGCKADLEREREANAKLREALEHIRRPAKSGDCCMKAWMDDQLDNHMVDVADEALLAAKQDEGNE